MKSINLVAITRVLKKFSAIIERYHVTIIIVIVFGTLIAVVANVNNILSQPPDEEYRTQAQKRALHTNFDQETIQAIQNLRARQENASYALPPGRNNPFDE
jgi:hypothetical protein